MSFYLFIRPISKETMHLPLGVVHVIHPMQFVNVNLNDTYIRARSTGVNPWHSFVLALHLSYREYHLYIVNTKLYTAFVNAVSNLSAQVKCCDVKPLLNNAMVLIIRW